MANQSIVWCSCCCISRQHSLPTCSPQSYLEKPWKMSTQKWVDALKRVSCAILRQTLIQWLHIFHPISSLLHVLFSPIHLLCSLAQMPWLMVPCALPGQISPWSCPVAHHSLSARLFSLLPHIDCLSTPQQPPHGMVCPSVKFLPGQKLVTWDLKRLKSSCPVQHHNLVLLLRYVLVICLVCKSRQCLSSRTSGDTELPGPSWCHMKRDRNGS